MMKISDQLHIACDLAKDAEQEPDPLRAIKKLREVERQLHAVGMLLRRDITQLVMAVPPQDRSYRYKPTAAMEAWKSAYVDPEILTYWTSRGVRASSARALAKLGIKDLDALSAISERRLRATPFIGQAVVSDVDIVLALHGRDFAPYEEDPLPLPIPSAPKED